MGNFIDQVTCRSEKIGEDGSELKTFDLNILIANAAYAAIGFVVGRTTDLLAKGGNA